MNRQAWRKHETGRQRQTVTKQSNQRQPETRNQHAPVESGESIQPDTLHKVQYAIQSQQQHPVVTMVTPTSHEHDISIL